MRKGFTLVEAMIIVALLGIIAAIALPRFGGITERRLEMEARRIQSDLRLTRRMAITNGVNYILKVYPVTNEYKIYRGSIADVNQVGETRTLPSQITASGDDEVTFSSLGSATAAKTIVLTTGSSQYNIAITAATGRIAIAQP